MRGAAAPYCCAPTVPVGGGKHEEAVTAASRTKTNKAPSPCTSRWATKKKERACKPDSVPGCGSRVAVIPLGRLLPTASSDAPEGVRGPRALSSVLLQVGFAKHPSYPEC
jgi:hypothetical protein